MKKLIIPLLISLCFTNAHAKVKHNIHKSIQQLESETILIADNDGNFLKSQNIDMVRPIASISKLMLALIVSEQDFNEELNIPANTEFSTKIPKYTGSLTREELLKLALIKSDNFAAHILCLNIPLCIDKMNEKAIELNMTSTHFEEPTGLSKNNVSNAEDLLKLLKIAALQKVITSIAMQANTTLIFKHKSIVINNTNPLIKNGYPIFISKTGYTIPAGGCIVVGAYTSSGIKYFIILGSKDTHSRIIELGKLLKQYS